MVFGRDGCEQRTTRARFLATLALCVCVRTTRALRTVANSSSEVGVAQECKSFDDWSSLTGWDSGGSEYTVSKLSAGGVFTQHGKSAAYADIIIGYYQEKNGNTISYPGGSAAWCTSARRGTVTISEDNQINTPTVTVTEPDTCVYELSLIVPKLCVPTPPPTPAPATPVPTPKPAPAQPARLSGDPHAKNLRGEMFDIFEVGRVLLFQIPRLAASRRDAQLTLEAHISRGSEEDCHSSYMRTIFVDGRMFSQPIIFDVGELRDLSAPFTFQVGEDSPIEHIDGFSFAVAEGVKVSGNFSHFMGSFWRPPQQGGANSRRSFFMSIKGARIHVQKIVKPHLKLHYLNVETENLQSLSTDVGGLLGFDSHAKQRQYKHECETLLRERNVVPLMSDVERSFYSASL